MIVLTVLLTTTAFAAPDVDPLTAAAVGATSTVTTAVVPVAAVNDDGRVRRIPKEDRQRLAGNSTGLESA